MSEIARISYGQNDFNFLMRTMEYYVENHHDGSEKVIKDLIYKFKEVHDFFVDDGVKKIVLYMTLSDMANIMNVYEGFLFNTAEARILTNTCKDWYGELLHGV